MTLHGRGILITRPRERAQGLAKLVEAAGGRAILFPAIEIQDVPLRKLAEFDLAIFVSPTAVKRALAAMKWPPRAKAAALGRGTQRELERHGIKGVIAPDAGADSEAQLAVPQLQRVAGRRIVILRGEGGRSLLGDTLAARGAQVEYAECYRRVRPQTDSGPLLTAFAKGAVHAVTVSSAEGLENLFEMLGTVGREHLKKTPLFVPHARIAAEAKRLGLGEASVGGASDQEMLERLVAYFRTAK
ncbi:MAG: uroporphyrinogen-III synthase [Betaproteobacteria bacterium]|nr:MAG: uroporphyrinogen-III synthase [Betaproteobacteria bacterium]